MTMKTANHSLPQKVEEECSSESGEQFDACFLDVIKSIAKSAPQAIFSGLANDGVETFQMNILLDNKIVFNSTRVGTHADGESGISLMFNIHSDEEDMDYIIESGQLTTDGNATPYIYVPVRRRIVSDLVYVFTEGCSLTWEEHRSH